MTASSEAQRGPLEERRSPDSDEFICASLWLAEVSEADGRGCASSHFFSQLSAGTAEASPFLNLLTETTSRQISGLGARAISSFNQIDQSPGLQRTGTPSAQISSYFQDGIDLPKFAAEKKGDGGGKPNITVGGGDSVEVKCENGARPNVRQNSDGIEVSCPDNGPKSGDKSKPQPKPPVKDSPSGSPIID